MRITRIIFAKKKLPKYDGRGEEFKYWERYLFREKAYVRGPEVYKPLVGYRKTTEHKWYYDEHLPMTTISAMRQKYGKMPLVKPIKEWFIFLGDYVEIMVGRDKGKVGEVCEVIKERNWCFVKGLHVEWKEIADQHPSYPLPLKKFIPTEKPLLVTHEVKLVDPSDLRATDFEWRYTEEGERVRVSIRSGRTIPIPKLHKDTWIDNVNSSFALAKTKNTTDANLQKVTFKPQRKTFEQDILDDNGIETKPRKNRSYWY
ncbi:39S ribosomal protein L24 [Mactra antiquata]